MKNGDEFCYPGGVYWYGKDDDRTDFYLQVGGPGINEAKGTPRTVDFRIVTGNGEFTVCGILPDNMVALGRWLMKTATDAKDES